MAHEEITVDELDRAIVHALQVDPRAPWNLVAAAVGADATTVARRWSRLSEAGAAWIACYPAGDLKTSVGVIEFSCAHGRMLDVADEIAADPYTIGVSVLAGRADVVAEVITPDFETLSRYVLERLSRVDGILHTRTRVVMSSYREGSRWRLGVLDPGTVAGLSTALSRRRRGLASDQAAPGPVTEQINAVAEVLAVEPRITSRDLAGRLGVSSATAQRRIDATLARQPMLRCELARSLSGHPVSANFLVHCPPDDLDAVSATLGRLPEARAVLGISGSANLYFAAWLHTRADIQRLESWLSRKFPGIRIADRSIVLRVVKLCGELLDVNGRSVGRVPLHINKPLAAAPTPA